MIETILLFMGAIGILTAFLLWWDRNNPEP